ncbi:MarR family winged helix-turn-helix transcriptional regulator [Altererythrobacter sp. CAU 1778]
MSQSARLVDFLPYLLSVTSNAVSTRIAEKYRVRFGLKIAEWRVLAVLGDAGPKTQRELTAATLMDKVAVNRACKSMVDRGLIVRQPNAEDGRSHRLEMTGDGAAIYAEVMPLAKQMEAGIFADFSAAEREELKQMLRRISDRATALD